MRLLYVLSAAGFALFLSGLYSARATQPQKRTERRSRRSYSGPMLDLNAASVDELRAVDLDEALHRGPYAVGVHRAGR